MSNLTSGVVIDFTSCRRPLRPALAEPDAEVRQAEADFSRAAAELAVVRRAEPVHPESYANPWWDDLTPLEADRLLSAEQSVAAKMR